MAIPKVSHRTRAYGARPRSRRIALIYDARSAYDTKVMAGVATYIHEAAGWNVYIEESALKDQRLPDLGTWKGDGIIANFDHPRVAAAVVKSRLPAVGFGSGYGWYPAASDIPYFFTNNQAIAALAADHLTSRGLRNFAFCGYPGSRINGWSSERQESFKAELAETGIPLQGLPGENGNGSDLGLPAQVPGRLAEITPETRGHSRFKRYPGPADPGILQGLLSPSAGRRRGARRR